MVKNTNSILFQDISQLIEAAKNHVARQTNSTLVHLYWQIGHRITQDILKSERAEYGNKIIKNLAQKLTLYYGRGFNARSLSKMVRFSKLFPNEIVPTVSALLSWSHFDELMALNDTLKRNFYTEMCRSSTGASANYAPKLIVCSTNAQQFLINPKKSFNKI